MSLLSGLSEVMVLLKCNNTMFGSGWKMKARMTEDNGEVVSEKIICQARVILLGDKLNTRTKYLYLCV